ncbi:MAG: hypothetical protein ACXABC_16755, partial [Candidatus Thorarchaeota archaeon]
MLRKWHVTKILRKTGDIGAAAEELLESGGQMSLAPEEATVSSVYDTLDSMAKVSGSGSNREKISK